MSDLPKPVHADDDDLVLYIQGRLTQERLALIDPHLSGCDTCREKLAQNIGSQFTLNVIGKTESDERRERSEDRFNTGSDATLQLLRPWSSGRSKVEIVDISRHGLGILAPQPILPGTIVQVRFNTAVEVGEVRHCTARDEGGYRMGLRFIAVAVGGGEVVLRPGAAGGDLKASTQQPDRQQTANPKSVNPRS